MRWRGGAGAALAAVLCLSAATAEATLIEALSLGDLVSQSDTVVLVSCVGERALRDASDRIVTDYDLTVEDTLRGTATPGEVLTMRALSGEIGDLAMRIEGEPRLIPGRRYMLFLRSVDGVRRPVGMSQGVLPVTDDRGALLAHPGGGGLSLVHDNGGRLVPAPAALLHPEPLEQLRERVLEIVRRTP